MKNITVQSRIESHLAEAFAPEMLKVEDESAMHKGHAGARAEGESHFRVHMVSARFEGVGRVARHRLVYDALSQEISEGLHALALHLYSPQEYALKKTQ